LKITFLDEQKQILEAFQSQISGMSTTLLFQQQMKGLLKLGELLSYAENSLSLLVLEIESINHVDKIKLELTYPKLCNYLWMRDQVLVYGERIRK
jgi:hypothetical protein